MACTDLVIEERYANWGEANQSGLFRRGWLPLWLPPETKNIKEKHDLDTNRSTAVFNLDKQHQTIFSEKCHKVTEFQSPIYFKLDFKSSEFEGADTLKCGDQFTMLGNSKVIMWRP